MRVTTVERTLVDLATVVSEDELAIALEMAWKAGVVTPAKMRMYFDAYRDCGVDGMRLFERALRDCESRPRHFDSPTEVLLWLTLHRENMPIPEVQVEMKDEHGSFRVDFIYRGPGLVLETGGGSTKGTPEAYQRESRRTARLTAMGYRVMPISSEMLKKTPFLTCELIRSALGLPSARQAALL